MVDHPLDDPCRSQLERTAELLKAFAHPIRLAIVIEVSEHERCVHELVEQLGIAQSLASQHLRILRGAGLVRGRRRGREVVYSIADQHVVQIARAAIAHAGER
jgi:ArsR family transcriptional regulator, zinc-responsive transcriptional repressor